MHSFKEIIRIGAASENFRRYPFLRINLRDQVRNPKIVRSSYLAIALTLEDTGKHIY